MKFRFGIKAILLLTLVVAIAIPIFTAWRFEKRWATLREELTMIGDQFDDASASIHTRSIMNRDGDSMEIGISNREFVVKEGVTKLSAPSSELNSTTDRYYIQPPGLWVPDIETAIETWDGF